MENINQSSISQQEFSGYIKNPERIDISDEKIITSLIEKFPYAQILHAFEAKCHDRAGSDTFLEKAALYIPDRSILYNIIHKPDYFRIQPSEKSVPATSSVSEEAEAENHIEAIDNRNEGNSGSFLEEPVFVSSAGTAIEEYEAIEIEDGVTDNPDLEILPKETEPATDTPPEVIEIPEADPFYTSDHNEHDRPDEPVRAENDLYEDVRPAISSVNMQEPGGDEIVTDERTDEPAEKPGDETEKLIISNIAASDFFRFEEKIDDQLTYFPDKEQANENVGEDKQRPAREVSKYDDDKMPYTFLWWLNKTRKEHAATYQPYTTFKLDTTRDIKKDPAPVLNQQIIENIFHLQSPLEDVREEEKPKTVEFTVKRKDDHIIERFIREEPQIRPPQPEKLDTENKAKRSSEDSYDMVSETLANVYIEQMLFHKAIDTYKKLSLKFPEKSAYFADQIRKLETTH